MKERAALTAALASLNAKPWLYIKYATHTAAERDTPATQCTSTTPVHGVGSVQNWVGQRKGLRMRTQLQCALSPSPGPRADTDLVPTPPGGLAPSAKPSKMKRKQSGRWRTRSCPSTSNTSRLR